jgi:hypothetical protein
MITLPIDLSIVSDESSRQHHLDFAFPNDSEFWEIPPRPRDNRIVGSSAVSAARLVWHFDHFTFNDKRQLVREGGKRVTRKWLAKLLDRLFVFIYDGCQVDPPVSDVMLELEMRIAWELNFPHKGYRR